MTYFSRRINWLVGGSILAAVFAAYVVSIGWAISKGRLASPEGSDDDSGSGDDGDDTASTRVPSTGEVQVGRGPGDEQLRQSGDIRIVRNRRCRGLRRHIWYLIFGFLAICLAGYVLSHAAINVTDAFGISDILFGIVILAIATTLPEKFIAVLSGNRGHTGILVANTVGSNIFLLSLCLGIIMLDTAGRFDDGSVNIPELGVLWGSTLAFTLTVWFGGKFDRWIGGIMLLCYIAFMVLEFTVIHGVSDMA